MLADGLADSPLTDLQRQLHRNRLRLIRAIVFGDTLEDHSDPALASRLTIPNLKRRPVPVVAGAARASMRSQA